MLPDDFEEKKEKQDLQIIKKISNLFLYNKIENSSLGVLKTLYYVGSLFSLNEKLLKDLDQTEDRQLVRLKFDIDKMLMFTNLTRTTLRRNLDLFQKTSIAYADKNGVESFVLAPRFKINYQANEVEIDIYGKIARLVIKVADNFSFVNVKEFMKLENKHSIRMLGLLYNIASFSKRIPKRKRLSLEILNQLFGTKYKYISEIERKILIPVKEELDNTTKLTFVYQKNYEPKGKGRPVFKDITIDLIIRDYIEPKLINI